MHNSLSQLSANNPQKLLLFDGAMGTLLWSYGYPRNMAPRLATLNNAELVKKIHQEYLSAGADIITTNTFGALMSAGSPSPSPSPLEGEGMVGGPSPDEVKIINSEAVKLARSVAGNKAYVAGDVAPCMAKNLSPAEMVLVYGDQIKVLVEGGIDLLVLETFTNLESVQLAIHAAFEVTGGKIPLVVMMTVGENGDLASGEDVGTLAPYLKEKRVTYFGFNCSFGPESVLRALQKWGPSMGLPLATKPNAGMPTMSSPPREPFCSGDPSRTQVSQTVDSRSRPSLKAGMTAHEFAKWGPKFVDAGAKIIGGCCGTTPAHIQALKLQISPPHPSLSPKGEGI